MIEDYINYENILITTRLNYEDGSGNPKVTEERNLFYCKRVLNYFYWGDGLDGIEMHANDVEAFQYSEAFNFPELPDKWMLGLSDLTDRELKRGDFNKEFVNHEHVGGDYFIYFTHKGRVFAARGEQMLFEYTNLRYMFRREELEDITDNVYWEKELKNYNDMLKSKIWRNKLKAYL